MACFSISEPHALGRSAKGSALTLALLGLLACGIACSGDDGAGGPTSTTTSSASAGSTAGSTAAAGGASTTTLNSTLASSGGAGGSSGGGGSAGTAGDMDDAGGGGGMDPGDGACGGFVMATAPDTHCASPDGGRGYGVGAHTGSESDDDDCLYHVKLSVPCIPRSQSVTFTIILTDIGTTTPATGAAPLVTATIGSYPLPNTNPMSTESNGVYTIGPVLFDRMGRWTTLFHVYDPIPAKHGHFSFYVDVP